MYGVTMSRRVLQQLRTTLERDAGLQAAGYCQKAGFAGGEALADAFRAWLSALRYGVEQPRDLDALGTSAPRFLSFSSSSAGGRRPSDPWAARRSRSIPPTGLKRRMTPAAIFHPLASLRRAFSRFPGPDPKGTVAVMEVECRSRGDTRCRFLACSPETLAALYERMAQGMTYAGEALSP